jgi:arginyl-tRNA synthetase
MKEVVKKSILTAIESCFADGSLTSGQIPPIVVEKPAHEEHGDFASNVAMLMAKAEKKPPRAVAEAMVRHLQGGDEIFAGVEIAGPGFINFRIRDDAWQRFLLEVAKAGEAYGRSGSGQGKKVQVEFVSANPTGPLHVGHGRGAALGDTLARLLTATGWDVTREFYYNDAGQQINNLALSVQARCLGIEPGSEGWPADGYQGEYIRDVADSYLA